MDRGYVIAYDGIDEIMSELVKGTSIFSEQLPGNFFLNVAIMGVVASLASGAVIIFNGYFSRQKFQAFTFFLAGGSCILCSIFQAVIPDQLILIVSFGILAKFSAQSKHKFLSISSK